MLWEGVTAETVELWASFLDRLFPNLVLTEPFVAWRRIQPGALPEVLTHSLQCRQQARRRTTVTNGV